MLLPETTIQSFSRKHRFLMLAILFIIGVAYFLSNYKGVPKITLQLDRILQMIVVLWSSVCVYFGYRIYKKGLSNLRIKNHEVQVRLERYIKHLQYVWLLIVLPLTFTAVCYVLTANGAFLAVMIILWVLFALTAPNKQLIELLLK